MTDRYKIPACGEEPSPEMIDWLHQNTETWDGDDNGIVLTKLNGEVETGFPGDWIVRDKDGRYSIEKKGSSGPS